MSKGFLSDKKTKVRSFLNPETSQIEEITSDLAIDRDLIRRRPFGESTQHRQLNSQRVTLGRGCQHPFCRPLDSRESFPE